MNRTLPFLLCTFVTFVAIDADASGFVQKPGTVFAKVGVQTSRADKKYAGIFDRNLTNGVDLGSPIPFDPSAGGETSTFSLSVSALVVPLQYWEIGVYFPFYQVSKFSDTAFTSTTTGTGDLIFNTGYQLTPDTSNVATKIELQSKIPLTELPAEFQAIPLGDGQVDVAIALTTTWAILRGLHLSFSTLFRKRFLFVDGDRKLKFGDEFELGASVGGAPFHWLWLHAGYGGLFSVGTEDRSGQGAVTLSGRRQLHELIAGTYVSFGRLLPAVFHPLALDAAVRMPVAGEDYPIGVTYSLGLAFLQRF